MLHLHGSFAAQPSLMPLCSTFTKGPVPGDSRGLKRVAFVLIEVFICRCEAA
jgi:hypothetical protein